MNEQQKLFFQVNAGIKNIVGKELIHSDSIAIIEVLETLSYDLSIVTETASIAQYANFDLKVSYIDDDIYAFIEDYVNTIASKQKRWGLNITYINSERENLKVEFLPSEICTFISNILDNARKNNAKNVKIICGNRKIIFEDNGDVRNVYIFAKFHNDEPTREPLLPLTAAHFRYCLLFLLFWIRS